MYGKSPDGKNYQITFEDSQKFNLVLDLLKLQILLTKQLLNPVHIMASQTPKQTAAIQGEMSLTQRGKNVALTLNNLKINYRNFKQPVQALKSSFQNKLLDSI